MRPMKNITSVDYTWYIREGHYQYMAPERMLLILDEMKKPHHSYWRDHHKLAMILRVENELKKKVRKLQVA